MKHSKVSACKKVEDVEKGAGSFSLVEGFAKVDFIHGNCRKIGICKKCARSPSFQSPWGKMFGAFFFQA